jgi:hypothetical protein
VCLRTRASLCLPALSVGLCVRRSLGADLSSYPIPDGMERKEATMGKGKRASTASTQSYGYQVALVLCFAIIAVIF